MFQIKKIAFHGIHRKGYNKCMPNYFTFLIHQCSNKTLYFIEARIVRNITCGNKALFSLVDQMEQRLLFDRVGGGGILRFGLSVCLSILNVPASFVSSPLVTHAFLGFEQHRWVKLVLCYPQSHNAFVHSSPATSHSTF